MIFLYGIEDILQIEEETVSKKILFGLVFFGVMMIALAGCDNKLDMPLPPAVQPPGLAPPMAPPVGLPPVAAPPVAPPVGLPPVAVVDTTPPPPDTPLIPIGDDPGTDKPKTGGKTGVCKLPGPDTPGDELVGNYMCNLDIKGLPFGFKPPAFGCRIAAAGNGKFRLTPNGQRSGFTITETKLSGFKLDGKYGFSGQKLQVNTCMRAKGPGKYKGSGSGILNDDKKNRVKYTMTVTRQ